MTKATLATTRSECESGVGTRTLDRSPARTANSSSNGCAAGWLALSRVSFFDSRPARAERQFWLGLLNQLFDSRSSLRLRFTKKKSVKLD